MPDRRGNPTDIDDLFLPGVPEFCTADGTGKHFPTQEEKGNHSLIDSLHNKMEMKGL